VLEQALLDVYIRHIEHSNSSKPWVAGRQSRERNLAAFVDGNPKYGGAIDSQVAKADVDAVLSNPNACHCRRS
jgi:hypothetical protein